MAPTALGRVTIPFSIALISFLSYGSQILFHYIEPSPLDFHETLLFNTLMVCIYVSYVRACWTNVGWVPSGWSPDNDKPGGSTVTTQRRRWCRKCEAVKPPRAHHCKICARCVPRMDHHCPWTASCVSHRTFPHFIRFLCYSVVTMCYLTYFLYIRGAVLWESRNLPSYLGPTMIQMVLLLLLVSCNSMTLFGMSLLLLRNLWSLGANITTIEGWEIDRHQVLVRRARKHGGYLDGPGGVRLKIEKQEFPYDIGIYQNVRQWMGTSIFFWLWPFAPTPSNESGLSFETNGFEDSSTSWPPPDPDRLHKAPVLPPDQSSLLSDHDYVEDFRLRQRKDRDRPRQTSEGTLHQRQPHVRKHSDGDEHMTANNPTSPLKGSLHGGQVWRDSEGERLEDFGLDAEIEFYDEDDIPLAELLRRRKGRNLSNDVVI